MKRAILLLIFVVGKLSADLDGRVDPILVNSTYTFTDGESARGAVFFNFGFDLPINGTIYLDLAPGAVIRRDVNMNGGTIVLENDIQFYSNNRINGRGFLYGYGKSIYASDIRMTSTLTILGNDIKFRGIGNANYVIAGRQNGVLDLTQVSTFSFINTGLLFDVGGILTTTTHPAQLFFTNVDMRNAGFLEGGFAHFYNPSVEFEGRCKLRASTKNDAVLFDQTVVIKPSSFLECTPGSNISIGNLMINDRSSTFLVQASTLDMASTVLTNSLFIGDQGSEQGTLLIDGVSILKATGGNPLEVSPTINLAIAPGALLQIDTGVNIRLL